MDVETAAASGKVGAVATSKEATKRALIASASEQGRIILTRDRQLFERRACHAAFFVDSQVRLNSPASPYWPFGTLRTVRV